MERVFWLIEGKLGGRAGPCVAPWSIEELQAAGVTAVVSTDEECHAETIRRAGFKHIPKFMPTAYPTTPALVERFADLVRDAALAVLEELRAGGCVVVHCYAGRDRTGLVLCAVLMELQGLSKDQAYKAVKLVRPVALTGPGVTDVLEEYALRLESGYYRD